MTVSIPTIINVIVAMIDLRENRLIPLIPCPLVHPLLNLVPKPTMAPPIINKTNELHVDEEFNYKSNLKLYSTNNGSWLDIFSYENSNDNNYPTTSFFDWYYTADNDNKPIMVFNGDRVYLADSNLNLDNNNKYLSFIDNSHFFQNPAIDDTNNDGFTFSGRTFGWFLEDSIKKWIFTAGTTANSNWNFPDNMGVRIDANSSVTTEYSAIEAKMNFKIYAGTTDGVDWSGNIKVFLAAVYDDRSESLPGHQFTFSGGAETLDLSAEGAFLKIECSIRPQNDSEEFLFNDRRITGIRLYYTHSEESFETYWSLGAIDFRQGFLKTNEVLKNVRSYYPYRIKEHERPDIIAQEYYGSSDLVFLIFLANNIQDPLYDWPLFGNELTNLIKEKYGSVDSAKTDVHHYEQILRSGSNKTVDTPKILEKVAIVDKESYDLLDATKRKIIYNYDYEIMKNNAKKEIVLIENTFSKQILTELRSLYAN